jgi:hypothetical protein
VEDIEKYFPEKTLFWPIPDKNGMLTREEDEFN